jgi:hypothetical protein
MNIDEIKAKIAELETRNAHWKKCQDGSYEMALDRAGYWKLKDQLKELENGKSNNQ